MGKFILMAAASIALASGLPSPTFAQTAAPPGAAGVPPGGAGGASVATPPPTLPATDLPTARPARPALPLRSPVLPLSRVRSGPVDIPFSRLVDIPYYKLNYRLLDDTYEERDAKARRYASFRWDSVSYCRYPSGWNGPGAYHFGDRHRDGYGWDGGYPWQGPGVEADHEDAEAFAEAKAEYAIAFRHAGECAPHDRHYRRHRYRPVVLRRKD